MDLRELKGLCLVNDYQAIKDEKESIKAMVPDIKEKDLYYLLEYIVTAKYSDVQSKIISLNLLEDCGISVSKYGEYALKRAVQLKDLNLTTFFLRKGLDANQSDGILLYYAAEKSAGENAQNAVRIFNSLIDRGAKIDNELKECIEEAPEVTGKIMDLMAIELAKPALETDILGDSSSPPDSSSEGSLSE